MRVCTLEGCGQEFRALYIGTPREYKYCSRKCAAAARTLYAHRRAASKASSRMRKAQRRRTWDGITDQQIFERDSWICQIPGCGFPDRMIDPELRWPEPLSASADHIVPPSLGGDDTQANKRASHWICNSRRGKSMAGETAAVLADRPALERPARPRKPVWLPWPRRLFHRPCRFCGVIVSAPKPPRSRTGAIPEFTVCQVCQGDAKCSSCGASMYITLASRPPETRVCQACRRSAPAETADGSSLWWTSVRG